ncbi:MAG TPA: hypothetical protein VE999_06035 [Gemmataceae bacterium]|nr:hypothetical protein [Gemmataceae bacterium]
MDKKIVGLMGAVTATALTAPQGAQAMPAQPENIMQISSYAQLLDPIPNAAQVLQAVDSSASQNPARIQKTQYYYHHHHHHHHHHWWRHFFYHHHHHHHHHFFYHHHHHHHHHAAFFDTSRFSGRNQRG